MYANIITKLGACMILEILKSPSFLASVITVCCTLLLFLIKEIIDTCSCYYAIITELKVLGSIISYIVLSFYDISPGELQSCLLLGISIAIISIYRNIIRYGVINECNK